MQIDPRWTIFRDVKNNFDDFISTMVPEMYLRPQVPKDVRENCAVIRRLLEHSYYCYEFYDVAVTQSVMTLEMAVKIRFRELGGDRMPPNLLTYLQWFHDHSYFEVINREFLDHIRKIRNHLAHPSGRGVAGPMARPVIENVIDLINALYEDPQLRKQRMNEAAEIRKHLEGFEGAMKISDGQTEQLCFEAWIAFIDNKTSPTEYHLYYRPCYEVPERDLHRLEWIASPVMYFKATRWEDSGSGIIFHEGEGKTLAIAPVTDVHERSRIAQWKKDTYGLLLVRPDCVTVDGRRVDPFHLHLRAFNRK